MSVKREPAKKIPRAKKDESVVCRFDTSDCIQDRRWSYKNILAEGCYQLRVLQPRWNEE
jgi:hypothetical protein